MFSKIACLFNVYVVNKINLIGKKILFHTCHRQLYKTNRLDLDSVSICNEKPPAFCPISDLWPSFTESLTVGKLESIDKEHFSHQVAYFPFLNKYLLENSWIIKYCIALPTYFWLQELLFYDFRETLSPSIEHGLYRTDYFYLLLFDCGFRKKVK